MDWQIRASLAARRTHNPIRSVVDGLSLEPNPGKSVIALSIGDPTVFGNLKPPQEVIVALHESIDTGLFHGYAPTIGHLEARQAVARYASSGKVAVDPKDVILCSGCSSALDLCISALADPGQNILIPRPGFPLYKTLAQTSGIEVRSYNLLPQYGWQVDVQHLEYLIDSNTAAIVICNPSNPCGSVFSADHLTEILRVASRHHLPIIADEIYEHLIFQGQKFYSLASLSEDVPILSCSGLTKRFLVPGWRMGWIIIHDRNKKLDYEIRRALLCLSQRTIGSNTIVQGALPSILSNTPQSFYDDTIEILQRHAELVYELLSKVKGLRPVMPQGAMYMMVGISNDLFPKFESDVSFVEHLMAEESIFCLPGQCFDYPNYIRLVLTAPVEQLKEACMRISQFCERHQEDNNIIYPSINIT